MRKVMMISAAAAMAAAVPAIADGQGRGHGKGHAKGQQSHPAACPPGLANRNPPCVPPGQARRMFREGQRVPRTFRNFVDYDAIPLAYRDRYDIPVGQRYIYRDNALYVVDPTTRLVRSIIDLID
jgi:hypothetical protein